MNNRDKARILSPLLLFVIHVVYLVAWSPDPFLKKWIDGSFTFFVALVLCNLIRARVSAAHATDESGDDRDSDGGAPRQDGEP